MFWYSLISIKRPALMVKSTEIISRSMLSCWGWKLLWLKANMGRDWQHKVCLKKDKMKHYILRASLRKWLYYGHGFNLYSHRYKKATCTAFLQTYLYRRFIACTNAIQMQWPQCLTAGVRPACTVAMWNLHAQWSHSASHLE